ncbi:MAG: Ldh family oxidoreductase [Pseudomonadota bacterium]
MDSTPELRIPASDLTSFLCTILHNLGADHEQTAVVCEALVWSDLIGRRTHGVWRFPAYAQRFQKGLLKCPCEPRVTRCAPASSHVDGDGGFGHFVAHFAMDVAIQQAREVGASIVTVSNSNHFGVAGYYANLAAQKNMVGLVLSNSIAKMAPTGGVKPVFGTNPLAYGLPRKNSPPLLFDSATSAVSGGSVIRAQEQGECIPEGALVDDKGQFITDPSRADEGVMLPFGGAKGAGLALLVELLTGILAGGSISTEVRSMFNDFSGNGNNSHCFIAIDIGQLLSIGQYYERLELLVGLLHESAASEHKPVRLPGEERWRLLEKNQIDGVPLESSLIKQLIALAGAASVSIPTVLTEY